MVLKSTGYEYDTLMNMLQVSVSKHLLDEHFTLIWANDFYYDLIGYGKKEYVSLFHNQPDLYYMNDSLNVHDEALWKSLGEQVVQALNDGKDGYTMISRMRRKDGRYIWVQMNARFTEEFIDGCRVSYTAMTDITEVMQIRLEQSVTYDNLPGFVAKFVVRKGCDFKLIEANERFFDFFGSDSVKNMEYPLFRENVRNNLPVFEEHEAEMLRGDPVHFTVQMNGQNGHSAWFQVNASCIGNEDGGKEYLAIYVDVTNETELRRMQKQLEAQAERLKAALRETEAANRAKSDFLSRMSHDIRTPLNAVLGMKDIALEHLNDSNKVGDCLNKIGLSGQHLLGLINDVLDMSKIESGEMVLREDSVSLSEIMRNIVTIMQPQFKERNQEFCIRLQGVVHEQLLSDALRIRQVFLNILSNACKFTPAGGKITVDVQELSSDDETARFSFVIEDTGIGMQPEFLAHLFDAFSRELDSRVDKTEGTGLGMAITKNIVELLGGSIDVRSAPGKGSVFRVELPLKIDDTPLLDGKFPNLHILVADDDVVLCETTAQLMRTMGIYADWVNDGYGAIEKIKTATLKNNAYDAILLDWKMPGQNGLETTLQIRKMCGESLPVLVISAYDWSDIEQSAKSAGVTGFLQKPIFVSTLIRGIYRYVLGGKLEEESGSVCVATDFSGKRFLLVEDNLLNQEVANDLLSDMGAEITLACDGKEAVEVFSASETNYFDIVLMDIQMPVMNGYEAAKAIRALNRPDARTTPILAMTADAFAEDIVAAKASGMDGHCPKPLDKLSLKREIKKYLK